MLLNLRRFLISSGVVTLAAACDPNVIIGAKRNTDDGGVAGQSGSAGIGSTGGTETTVAGGGGSGAETGGEGGMAGATLGGEAGASAGAGGAPDEPPTWCATAPWLNTPVQFTSDVGNEIPAGDYSITYMSGAQIHDVEIGYEVTGRYYGKNALEAGHHVYSAPNPETGTTKLWLDSATLLGTGKPLPELEAADRGHTWPLNHPVAGELFITLYDDYYEDNSGPGSRFCIKAAP